MLRKHVPPLDAGLPKGISTDVNPSIKTPLSRIKALSTVRTVFVEYVQGIIRFIVQHFIHFY